MLREHYRDGNGSPRDPGGGVDFLSEGTPRERFRNLADHKNSGASIRTHSKLSSKISCVAAKRAVDSWSTVLWSCCKKHKATFTAAVKDVKMIHG